MNQEGNQTLPATGGRIRLPKLTAEEYELGAALSLSGTTLAVFKLRVIEGANRAETARRLGVTPYRVGKYEQRIWNRFHRAPKPAAEDFGKRAEEEVRRRLLARTRAEEE